MGASQFAAAIANELQKRSGPAIESEERVVSAERLVYVCNCNGIRERDVRAALNQGAARPADVLRHCGGRLQCAKCVCDIRRMIHAQREAEREALRHAAE